MFRSTEGSKPARAPERAPEGVAAPARKPPMGSILIAAGRLTPENAALALRAAARRGVRFGEAGILLGFLKPEDVQFALAAQFSFPLVARDDATLASEVVAGYLPHHPVAERMRALRVQLKLRCRGRRSGVVVAVCGPTRSDGRSFTASNLAVVFAQMGCRTLLIDADMRHPSQHRLFKIDNRIGLSTLLAGRSGVESVRKSPALAGLHILPSGPTPPNPLDLLESPLFDRVLAGADRNFGAVLIDTPAGADGADAEVACAKAGFGIVVARASHTPPAAARRYAAALSASDAKVLGVVFNEA